MMAAAAGAIFYFRDEITGKFHEATGTDKAPTKEEVVATGEEPVGSNRPSKSTTAGGATKNPGMKKPPETPVNPHLDPEDSEIAKRYPMPKFKSIDHAVGNWNAIPPSAFPRQITLKKPVKIVLAGGVGSATIPANSKVFALGARGGVVTVGRTNTASARGQVGINDTNFKEILSTEFNAWKKNQEQIVLNKRERYRNVMAQTKAAKTSTPSRNESGQLANEKELGKKPAQNSDGSVPLMLASLKRKDVTEIKPDIISSWGPVIREEVDGEAYWTSTVGYITVSMFGELNTEAQALMRNEKVIRWIYTGSGDSVP